MFGMGSAAFWTLFSLFGFKNYTFYGRSTYGNVRWDESAPSKPLPSEDRELSKLEKREIRE